MPAVMVHRRIHKSCGKLMEWRGNPGASVSPDSLDGMIEEWFCEGCRVGVWIEFFRTEITGFKEITVLTRHINEWKELTTTAPTGKGGGK